MAKIPDEDPVPKWLSITGKPLPGLDRSPAILGRCRDISDFEQLNQLGEGTYGVVHRARDRESSKIVALKQVRIFENDRGNGIPITALREISILKSLRHPNVVSVLDVAVGAKLDDVYMVMEYAEQDLANLLDHARVKYSESEVKCLMKQLFEGLEYLHRKNVIHRDIKMSNLLLTAKGILKIADFGMARPYCARPLTPGCITLWYRPPELLLYATRYTPSCDLWSAGCIMGELIHQMPLLPGNTDSEQFSLITKLLGAPNPRIWPKMTLLPGLRDEFSGRIALPPQGVQRENLLEVKFRGQTKQTIRLINGLLTYDPEVRLTAPEALRHAYFKEAPAAQRPEMLQSFPEIRNHSDFAEKAGKIGGGGAGAAIVGKRSGVVAAAAGANEGYVFDFGDEFGGGRREGGSKRQRVG